MAKICDSVPMPEAFAPSLLRFLDCQAQVIGTEGYRALAAPGSTASVLLTGMVTLLIAFLGYRMLLGQTPTVREGVLTFVKIGLVLLLATSWPAYQLLVYDVILRSPAEFAAAIGGATSLPGSGGGLIERIDGVDRALTILAIEGVGAPPIGADGLPRMAAVAPPPFLGFDSFAVGFARVIFLVSTVAAFAVVRVAAGLLLALAPLFAAFLLFDGTRGLFEGWIKALIGTALASLAISVALGLSLAYLEPWLANLLARRASGLDIVGTPAQLLAASTIFAIALACAAYLFARVALALRIPAWMRPSHGARVDGRAAQPDVSRPIAEPRASVAGRSRAAAIADAIAISQRRDLTASEVAGGPRAVHIARGIAQRDAGEGRAAARSSTHAVRRTRRRLSAHSTARDRRS